ncbi:cytochrome P450 6j1-like [Diabrotica undecimpunctata]|uniref:cytochrome P450 6j1-like n=1 Tax=Diabrotica undecimpunctata TaxID=50387 RepID=UPI003B63F656
MMLTSTYIFNTTLISILILIFTLYKYMTRHFDYWKKRGVNGPKPVPFYGNFFEIGTFKTTISEGLKTLYDYSNKPFVGIFVFNKPVLLLRSPELIGDVLVRDSHLFLNKSVTLPDHNKITKNLLFFQEMSSWKKNRSKYTPCFSPAKLKIIFPIIMDIAEEMNQYIHNGSEVMDVRDISGKFFVETIARCLFGLKARCFQNENAGFMKAYRGMFSFTWRNLIAQSAHHFMGELVNIFKLDFIESSIIDYLYNALIQSIESRKGDTAKTKDLIDMIIEMNNNNIDSKTHNKEELEETLAIVMSFMIAGGEATTSTTFYVLYELAINQHLQDKARNEVINNIKEYKGITFEGTQNTPYLELCINEALRKYAAIPHICRKASSEYKFRGTDLVIEEGTRIYIPIYGLQMDDKYFPQPKKYDPERLQNYNWSQDGKLVFTPFGAGPKRCLGDRFALTAMKVALMQILSKYRVDRLEDTPDELEFETRSILMKPKSGNFLKIRAL